MTEIYCIHCIIRFSINYRYWLIIFNQEETKKKEKKRDNNKNKNERKIKKEKGTVILTDRTLPNWHFECNISRVIELPASINNINQWLETKAWIMKTAPRNHKKKGTAWFALEL